MISKDILYNPLLLYSFVLVTFGQFILLSINEEWFFIGVLVVVCLLTSVFSKNLIVICVVGLCVLHVLQHQYKSSIEEGFGRKKRARRRRRRIAKRRRKKWGGARRKLFGRTKQEKRRNKRKRRKNNLLETTTNNQLNKDIRIANGYQPLEATAITASNNSLTGHLSEKYGKNIIDEDKIQLENKIESTKTHLSQFWKEFKDNIKDNIGDNTDLNKFKCEKKGKCSKYAQKHALESIQNPLQKLYEKILHGPEFYPLNDDNNIQHYSSGNIVN